MAVDENAPKLLQSIKTGDKCLHQMTWRFHQMFVKMLASFKTGNVNMVAPEKTSGDPQSQRITS